MEPQEEEKAPEPVKVFVKWNPEDTLPISVLESGTGTLPVALLFPGQGSQYIGMFKKASDLPAVRYMLERASEIVGYDIEELCTEGPFEKLSETRYTQAAVFIAGLAGCVKLHSQKPEALTNAQCVAGFSLGEYIALCVAGVYSWEDGLRLVTLRGEAMHDAATSTGGKMLSVIGFPKEKLIQSCGDAVNQSGPGNVCQISNFLFPEGYTVGGTVKAVDMCEVFIKKKGATRTVTVGTAGAFHTPMMMSAKERLSKALYDTLPRMKPPVCRVFMNVTGTAIEPGTDPKEIVVMLEDQLTNAVQWEASVMGMVRAGITEFYECGPGKQLKAMIKRCDQAAWKNCSNMEV